MRYVKVLKDYAVGQTFEGFLAVRRCEVRQTSNKKDYLDLTLSDGQTDMVARAWDHTGPAPTVNEYCNICRRNDDFLPSNFLLCIALGLWLPSLHGLGQPLFFITPRNIGGNRK